MKRAVLFAPVLFALLLAGCGGDDEPEVGSGVSTLQAGTTPVPTVPAGTNTPTVAPTVAPPVLAADLAFMNVDTAFDVMRFVAVVKNPSLEKSVSGMKMRWDAFDAAGARVGGIEREHPVIGPGETYLYVGGAGSVNLADTPATVKLTITDPGRYTDDPSGFWPVSGIEIENTYGDSYTVRGTFTAAAAASRTDFTYNAVLRDDAGNVLAANFDGGDIFPSLPPQLEPGTAYRVSVTFSDVKGMPASADMRAYPKP